MSDLNRGAAQKICGKEYTVRRGDSFYLISHRLGIPLKDLLAANPEVNPARLMVGDVLCIPTEEDDQPPVVVPTPPLTQTPAPDDWMDDEDMEAVPDLDIPAQPVTPPEELDPDMGVCPEAQRLTVMEGQTAADIQLAHQLNLRSLEMANPTVDFASLKPGQELCIPEGNTPCPLPSLYTLGEGENLESTAIKFNLPLGALLRANPCMAPQDFQPGVCISLPE